MLRLMRLPEVERRAMGKRGHDHVLSRYGLGVMARGGRICIERCWRERHRACARPVPQIQGQILTSGPGSDVARRRRKGRRRYSGRHRPGDRVDSDRSEGTAARKSTRPTPSGIPELTIVVNPSIEAAQSWDWCGRRGRERSATDPEPPCGGRLAYRMQCPSERDRISAQPLHLGAREVKGQYLRLVREHRIAELNSALEPTRRSAKIPTAAIPIPGRPASAHPSL